MRKIWKVVIISVAAGLTLAVLGLFLGASTEGVYFDKTGVHVVNSEEMRITELNLENVKSIDVDVSHSDVTFVSADKFGIDIRGYDNMWDWNLQDGALKIKHEKETSMQFTVFNFNMKKKSEVKIFLPKVAKLENVIISTESGNVNAGDFDADYTEINDSFGKVNLDTITSGDLQVELDSGDFTGKNLNIQNLDYKSNFGKGHFENVNTGKFSAISDSGDLSIKNCKLGDVAVNNSFGKITANGLYSSKANIVADSGDINLKGEFLGETVIESDFGKVNLTTSRAKKEYDYDISVDFGKITFDGEKIGNDSKVLSGGTSANILKIEASSGDVTVDFGK